LDEPLLVAAATMLDHGIFWIPVVHSKIDLQPVGYLRGERIRSRMIQKLSQGVKAHSQAQTAS
jgi:hypothetical protein